MRIYGKDIWDTHLGGDMGIYGTPTWVEIWNTHFAQSCQSSKNLFSGHAAMTNKDGEQDYMRVPDDRLRGRGCTGDARDTHWQRRCMGHPLRHSALGLAPG